MVAKTQMETWRAELVEEKAALEDELTAARANLKVAQSAHDAAMEEWRDLSELLSKTVGPHDNGMPGVLRDRLDLTRHEAYRAGERGPAVARVKSLESRIAGRDLAIRQIDRALSGQKVAQFRPVVESSYRKPQPVDFDTIQLPTGVAP